MKKNYKEFLITSEPFNAEILSSVLWELDINGISEELNCLRVFASADSSVTRTNLEEQLQKLVDEKMLFTFSVESYILEDRNWNEDWEKNINVIEVTDRIVIKPTFKHYESKPGQIIITIDPKMSFGTGEHATTKMMLKLIEKYIRPGMKILDVGSGTCVLAIAGVMLGGSHAVAVDNDEWCYENGIENCKLNNVTDKVDVVQGEIKDITEEKFDMITANIQKNVLTIISNEVKNRCGTDCIVLLSGLLYTDEDDIIKHYTSLNFIHIETIRNQEWISIVLKF